MVPTHFVRMLALPEDIKEKYDVSSMKFAAHTGAKCPVDVMREMIDWWGPVFRDAYGASEVGTVCAITSEEWRVTTTFIFTQNIDLCFKFFLWGNTSRLR